MRFFLFLMAFAIGFPEISCAALSVNDQERPIFAFFKLLQEPPDYDQWIMASSKYLATEGLSEERRQQTYAEEEIRLKWGFGTYDAHKDFLKVYAPITLALSQDSSRPVLTFHFPETEREEILYFPFPYGADNIALVIKDIAAYKSVTLDQKQYETLKPLFKTNTPLTARLKLRIRPLKADMKTPVLVDAIPFWPLVGDIAFLAFEIPAPETPKTPYKKIYSYSAPWYMTDEETKLLELLE